jgi:hypothetical protein
MSDRSVTTRTLRAWLDGVGILHTESLAGAEHTKADAEANLAAMWEVAGHQARPLLGDMRRVKALSREARTVYASSGPTAQSAVALLVESPLSRVIGTFFLGLNKPLVPTRLFATEREAAAWLRTFIA